MHVINEKSVEIFGLDIPDTPKAGENITLTCRFRLGGPNHRLYTVNWWRGKDQFFTYKDKSRNKKNAYIFDGIKVKVRFFIIF